MRKISLLLLFAVLCFGVGLGYGVLGKPKTKESKVTKPKAVTKHVKKEPACGHVGEKITYDIKLGNISLGKAVFRHLEVVQLEGRQANLITFNTSLARFHDLEKIYSDPDNFLPLKVERDINNWPVKEKITEQYDQKNFILTITKIKGRRKEKTTIKKDGNIHNAILLPYYVRCVPKLSKGWTFKARLPTQEFQIKLVDIEDIEVPSGKFKSYHFESLPKKIEIWITTDKRRIPIKIKGTGALGYTMVMRDYSL